MFHRLLTALAALALSPVAVFADVYEDHNVLYNSLEQVGVTLRVNNPDLCGDNWGGGHYNSLYRTMVICQDGYSQAKAGERVMWTANDMDTLRHEAHHVVQDCLLGSLGDNELAPLYTEASQWKQFVGQMPQERIDYIIKNYRDMGANDRILYLELEAFAAADHVSALTIANAVVQSCGV